MNEETDAQITGLDQLFMGIDIFNRFPLESVHTHPLREITR